MEVAGPGGEGGGAITRGAAPCLTTVVEGSPVIVPASGPAAGIAAAGRKAAALVWLLEVLGRRTGGDTWVGAGQGA